jgi:hypothetical protein
MRVSLVLALLVIKPGGAERRRRSFAPLPGILHTNLRNRAIAVTGGKNPGRKSCPGQRPGPPHGRRRGYFAGTARGRSAQSPDPRLAPGPALRSLKAPSPGKSIELHQDRLLSAPTSISRSHSLAETGISCRRGETRVQRAANETAPRRFRERSPPGPTLATQPAAFRGVLNVPTRKCWPRPSLAINAIIVSSDSHVAKRRGGYVPDWSNGLATFGGRGAFKPKFSLPIRANA